MSTISLTDVDVRVRDHVATLTGSVTTWQQRETAERAAANAPGITRVKNEILVEPLEPVDEICSRETRIHGQALVRSMQSDRTSDRSIGLHARLTDRGRGERS